MPTHSYTRGTPLTKSDSAVVTAPHEALYVGGAGNLNVIMNGRDGFSVFIAAAPAGTVLPIKIKKLLSTNTTATNVVALE